MFRKIRIAALSALLGLGALSAVPATAQADGIYFSFGSNGTSAGVLIGDRDRYHRPHRPHRPAQACTPALALEKALRMGLRHPRVTATNRNIIRVAGLKHHHRRAHVVFSRAPHGPVIRSS